MSQPIGKVSLDDLESFLKRHAEEWDVEGLSSFEELLPPHRPVTVDELILDHLVGESGRRPRLPFQHGDAPRRSPGTHGTGLHSGDR